MQALVGIFFALVLVIASLLVMTALCAFLAARAAPPQGRFVTIDGQRLHIVDVGDGPVLFLIHGLTGNIRHFSHSLIERLGGQFRVIAVDRPGSGYSRRAPGASARVRAQAATLAKLIRALELGRPLVVGHSLGGGVALALALDAPDCVGGLALLAPCTHPMSAPPALFRGLVVASPLARKIIAWTLAAPMGLLQMRKGVRAAFAPSPAPRDFGTRGGGLLMLRPSNYIAASEDLVAANRDLRDMVALYPGLSIPAGVLYARNDALLDFSAHGVALKEELPALELELHDDGGHMLPITTPDRAADFIRRMAAKLG
jgi:pimeloyl-ACP methyl ester carboxylesterase